MARLYREAPVNSIWEGAGNVNALDVLRALGKSRTGTETFLGELRLALGADARLDAAVAALEGELSETPETEWSARRTVERMALTFAGSLLVRHAPSAVAEAYCASRLGGDWGRTFGTLPGSVDAKAIVERAFAPR